MDDSLGMGATFVCGFRRNQVLVFCYVVHAFYFMRRSFGNVEEIAEFGITGSSITFRDIVHDGNAGSDNLVAEGKILTSFEIGIDIIHQLAGELPYFQVFEGIYSGHGVLV